MLTEAWRQPHMAPLTADSPDALLERLLTEDPPAPKQPCRLADLIGDRKLVVYGCGDGLITFSVFVLQKFDLRPEVLLDARFAVPTVLEGIPAIAPADYCPSSELVKDAVAVITVGKTRYHPEIIASLRTLGFQCIILAMDIYEYHLSHAPRGFEQLGPAYFRERAADIRAAYALLADDPSREIFTKVLHTHVARMPVPIHHEPIEDQYFPRDLVLSRGIARVINCGAYDGDTVRQLHARHGKIEALICLEPDADNFTRLCAYLAGQAGQLANSVMAFPCGVWRDDTQLRFGGGQRINSSICDDGAVVIQCVALDHVIPDFHPTYINMDIEGAEPEALRGAAGLIQRDRPDLGICVYHRPEHLWEIALYLHGLNLDYRFYLRNYTGFPAETVLYATA
jgi:FkbM family methyltransferase